MVRSARRKNENPVCRDCRQECKQTEAVTVLNCTKYRRKDAQLELKFTTVRRRNKEKHEDRAYRQK